MKLVLTLVVRDEADIVDAHIAFHLAAGVDYVIAMDHRSEDGTTEILESYEREGHLRLIRQDAKEVRQSEWVTSMARLAASEHGADWVINSDADEFWWPRGPSLKDALEAVPPSYGVVYAPMCYFLPRFGDDAFYELMTLRLLQAAPINNPLSRYRPSLKAAHRGTASVVVLRGNHEVERAGPRLASWYPLELLHFPDRSPEQFARKYANTIASWPEGGRDPGAFVLSVQGAIDRNGATGAFGQRVVAEDGSASLDKVTVVDPRLRDALRRLRAPAGTFLRPPELDSFELPAPSGLDATRHAVDSAVLAEAEHIRLHRDIDDLETKLRSLEHDRGRR